MDRREGREHISVYSYEIHVICSLYTNKISFKQKNANKGYFG